MLKTGPDCLQCTSYKSWPKLVSYNKAQQPQTRQRSLHMYLHTLKHWHSFALVCESSSSLSLFFQTPASYLATTLHFHGNAIKSNNKEKKGRWWTWVDKYMSECQKNYTQIIFWPPHVHIRFGYLFSDWLNNVVLSNINCFSFSSNS